MKQLKQFKQLSNLLPYSAWARNEYKKTEDNVDSNKGMNERKVNTENTEG